MVGSAHPYGFAYSLLQVPGALRDWRPGRATIFGQTAIAAQNRRNHFFAGGIFHFRRAAQRALKGAAPGLNCRGAGIGLGACTIASHAWRSVSDRPVAAPVIRLQLPNLRFET